MRKIMMLATVLAMTLVAAVPALAQDATVEGDGDVLRVGDDATLQSIDNTQVALQFLGEQNADQDVTIDGDENAVGGINQEQTQEVTQIVQNAQADDGSLALNGNDLFLDHHLFFWWF